jgi:hypothetical protein
VIGASDPRAALGIRAAPPWSSGSGRAIVAVDGLCLGMLALIAAVIQHTRILQRLEAPDYAYNAMRPITVTVAIMLLMIGAFGLVGILL